MFRYLLSALYEIWDYISSAAKRLFTPKLLVGVREPVAGAQFSKWLVFCSYEQAARTDLKSLLAAFKARGFGVAVVSSNESPRQYDGLTDLVLRIAPIGRDFAAYQQGFQYLESTGRLRDGGAVVFANDSVWFFRKYIAEIVERLDKGLAEGALVCGTMIADEIPHLSGWLFGISTNAATCGELRSLLGRNFARKSRRYNIRKGEHQILPTLRSARAILNLDLPGTIPAVPQCYTAIMRGTQCYYLKADSTLRINNARAKMVRFLATNSSDGEQDEVLRWLARRADILYRSRLRLAEMESYRRAYFSIR